MKFKLPSVLTSAVKGLRREVKLNWRRASAGALRLGAKAAERGTRPIERAAAALSPNVLQGFDRFVQGDAYTCGAESTRMVLAYFDQKMGPERARAILGATEDSGVDEAAIKRVLRKKGLRVRELAKPARSALMDAIDREEPVIVLLDQSEHWGVVYGYGRDSIYLADPSFLRAPIPLMSWRTFKGRWTAGYGLAIGHRR